MNKFLALCVGVLWTFSSNASTLLDEINKGSTDYSATIYIFDDTTGLPETAVAHTETGIDLWYRREGAALVAITEAALSALTDAHADGGLEPISDGEYRLDLPDAAVAAGADWVEVGGHIDDMVVRGGRIRLKNVNPIDDINATCQPYPYLGILMGAGCAVTSYTHSTGTVVLAGSLAIEANDQWNNALVALCTSLGCQVATVADYVDASQSLVLADPLNVDIEGDTITATVFGTPQSSAATTPPTATQIVDEWQSQCDADPTTCRVNMMEIEGSDATDTMLRPTVAGRTLDVTAGGTAGVDWANIESPTTTVGLTGTTVDLTAGAVDDTALNSASELQAAAAAALVAIDLDHLTNQGSAPAPTAGSVIDLLMDDGTAAYDRTTDSLQAQRDNVGTAGAALIGIPEGYIDQFACDSGDADTCVDAGLNEADNFWRGVALRSMSGTTAGMERCVVASDQSDTNVTVVPPFPASLGTGTVQLVRAAHCVGVDPTYTP